MFQFEILYGGKHKKVKGEQVGSYFGIDYRIGKGWMISHLPTGRLLINCVFPTKDDAVYLADLAEKSYGEILAMPSERVLLDNRYETPNCNTFYCLRNRLEDLDTLVTKEVIDGQLSNLS